MNRFSGFDSDMGDLERRVMSAPIVDTDDLMGVCVSLLRAVARLERRVEQIERSKTPVTKEG